MAEESELIVFSRNYGLPYSKGLMAQSLMATGVSPERAYSVSAAIERSLRRSGSESITLDRLRAIARDALGEEEGEDLIQRFTQWQTLTRLDRPLIVLIGGTTGVGKSTLATLLAHRLGITRVTSTDTVRQVMRAFFSPELMPAIHYSSFDAADAVHVPMPKGTDLNQVGFIEQTKSVAVGMNAVIQRAIDEAQSMVAEGVHLVPGFLDRSGWHDAVVLEFVLKVDDADRHRSHFYVREWETDGIRPLKRYIDNFSRIRKIQRYILARAAQHGVRVIDNESIDHTVKDVMTSILQAVSNIQQPAVRSIGG